MKTTDEISLFIAQWMAVNLQLTLEELDTEQTFLFYGMDSMDMVNLSVALSESLGVEVSPEVAYEHTTPQALATHALTLLA